MAFVETPVATNGDLVAPEGFQRDVGRADGPGQDRRVGYVGEDPCAGEEAGAFAGLGLAQLGEVAVVPARELVSGVPLALAVAQQDQRGHDVLEPWGGGPANGTRLVSLAPAKISVQKLLN